MRSYPDCIGHRRCPRGRNNIGRAFCRAYEQCLNDFVARELRKGRSISATREVLQSICPKDSDFACLRRIARVAAGLGCYFGRKAVDSAIKQSTIRDDCEPELEAREVRRAFGVYGRVPTLAKSGPVGRTRGQNFNGSASSGQGSSEISEGNVGHALGDVRVVPLVGG